jgi:hypothetical protein
MVLHGPSAASLGDSARNHVTARGNAQGANFLDDVERRRPCP